MADNLQIVLIVRISLLAYIVHQLSISPDQSLKDILRFKDNCGTVADAAKGT